MKKLCFFVALALTAVMVSCSSGFDNEKAGKLVEKYKSDPSSFTEDDARQVADLLVAYYDDEADAINSVKGKDEKEVVEAYNKFKESHKNGSNLRELYQAIHDKVPAEARKAVEQARERRDKAKRELKSK